MQGKKENKISQKTKLKKRGKVRRACDRKIKKIYIIRKWNNQEILYEKNKTINQTQSRRILIKAKKNKDKLGNNSKKDKAKKNKDKLENNSNKDKKAVHIDKKRK